MFDIGFTELVLLAGLGLIVLGPQRLPKVAAQLGRWVGQARRMSRTLMYQLRQEVDLDDPSPFSARGSAGASAGAKPKAAQKEKGGEQKETEAETAQKSGKDKEKEAETAQESGKEDTEQSQSGE